MLRSTAVSCVMCVTVPFAGCATDGNEAVGAQRADTTAWRAAFAVHSRLEIEQTPGSLVIEPIVTDDAGGYLVTEPKEAQVRVHDAAGRLLRVLGRSGAGPGELQLPSRARRAPDGSILVTDLMQPRLTRYDGAGVSATLPVPVHPMIDFEPLGDGSQLLAAGFVHGSDQLLHVIETATGRVVRSFMDIPDDPAVRQLATSLGFPSFALRDTEIAAAMALSDTLYFYDTSGAPHGRLHLPIPEWVAPSPAGSFRSNAEREDWLANLIQLAMVYWVGDDVAVVYGRRRGHEMTWGLILVARDGRVLESLFPAPRLLLVRADTLFFNDPHAAEPGTWLRSTRSR